MVLNFFASWCVPCQLEGPELVAFQFQHQQSGTASVVSVVFNDTTERCPRLPATRSEPPGPRWPIPDDSIALAYGVREDPTSFLIAPDGRVVASISGGVTAKGLDALVAKAEASGYGT